MGSHVGYESVDPIRGDDGNESAPPPLRAVDHADDASAGRCHLPRRSNLVRSGAEQTAVQAQRAPPEETNVDSHSPEHRDRGNRADGERTREEHPARQERRHGVGAYEHRGDGQAVGYDEELVLPAELKREVACGGARAERHRLAILHERRSESGDPPILVRLETQPMLERDESPVQQVPDPDP